MLNKKDNAVACGNCGFPISQAALDYKKYRYFVVELSSFQLKGCYKFTPKIAIVTNIKKAHIDYHKNLQDYYESKFKITKNQTRNDYLILNYDCSNTMSLFKNSIATKITFSLDNSEADYYLKNNKIYNKEKFIISIKNKNISEKYNILASCAAARLLGLSIKNIKQAISEFKGVKYRMEKIRPNIYNDAKSTNIFSTIAALKELKSDVFLICGGYDRNEELSGLENYLDSINCVFAYGATKEKIYHYFKLKKKEVYQFNTLSEAVFSALNLHKNEKILYSPMFASYDQYQSFEERGKEFNQIINSYFRK